MSRGWRHKKARRGGRAGGDLRGEAGYFVTVIGRRVPCPSHNKGVKEIFNGNASLLEHAIQGPRIDLPDASAQRSRDHLGA